jgi:deazaflavin-dependent oxidoreductase (nitroreductase family)
MTEHSPNSFPKPGTPFYSMIHKTESRGKYMRLFKSFNWLVILLYQVKILPILGLGKRLLVLQTRGRVSGRTRRNPTEYFRIDGVIHVISGFGEHAHWVKNMRARPDDVRVYAGMQFFKAQLEFLDNPEDRLAVCRWLVTKHAAYSRQAMGWQPGIDDPDTADFSAIVDAVTIVRISGDKS